MRKPVFNPEPSSRRGVLLSVTVSPSVYARLSSAARKAKIKETEFTRQAINFAVEHMPTE